MDGVVERRPHTHRAALKACAPYPCAGAATGGGVGGKPLPSHPVMRRWGMPDAPQGGRALRPRGGAAAWAASIGVRGAQGAAAASATVLYEHTVLLQARRGPAPVATVYHGARNARAAAARRHVESRCSTAACSSYGARK